MMWAMLILVFLIITLMIAVSHISNLYSELESKDYEIAMLKLELMKKE